MAESSMIDAIFFEVFQETHLHLHELFWLRVVLFLWRIAPRTFNFCHTLITVHDSRPGRGATGTGLSTAMGQQADGKWNATEDLAAGELSTDTAICFL